MIPSQIHHHCLLFTFPSTKVHFFVGSQPLNQLTSIFLHFFLFHSHRMSFMCKFPMKMLSKNMLSLYVNVYDAWRVVTSHSFRKPRYEAAAAGRQLERCEWVYIVSPIKTKYKMNKTRLNPFIRYYVWRHIIVKSLMCISLWQCNMGRFEWISDGKIDMKWETHTYIFVTLTALYDWIVSLSQPNMETRYGRVKKCIFLSRKKRKGREIVIKTPLWIYDDFISRYMTVDDIWKCAYISGYLLDET